jgi:paraquat-inducible protein B
MSHKANTTLIGAFLIGATAIVIATVIFFGDGRYFQENESYVMYFDRSVQGLELGAPMKLRGVKVGEVTGIESYVTEQSMSIINAVYVRVRRGEVNYGGTITADELVDALIANQGMRAQLRIQSLLTGLLYIELDFMGADSEMKLWGLDPDTRELPTAITEIEELSQLANRFDFDALSRYFLSIAENLNTILADPETLSLTANLNDSLHSITRLADDMDRVLLEDVAAAIEEFNILAAGINEGYPVVAEDLRHGMASLQTVFSKLENTLGNANYVLSDDSPLIYKLNQTLDQLSKAAKKISSLADTVERQPEALLKGKSGR